MSHKLYVYNTLAMMKETENFISQERVWCILFVHHRQMEGKRKIEAKDSCISDVVN